MQRPTVTHGDVVTSQGSSVSSVFEQLKSLWFLPAQLARGSAAATVDLGQQRGLARARPSIWRTCTGRAARATTFAASATPGRALHRGRRFIGFRRPVGTHLGRLRYPWRDEAREATKKAALIKRIKDTLPEVFTEVISPADTHYDKLKRAVISSST